MMVTTASFADLNISSYFGYFFGIAVYRGPQKARSKSVPDVSSMAKIAPHFPALQLHYLPVLGPCTRYTPNLGNLDGEHDPNY